MVWPAKLKRTTSPARLATKPKADMKEAANCDALNLATAIRLFCLNGDLLGAIAQAAFKGPYLDAVFPQYQTCKRHLAVAFRAWRLFNFDVTGIGDEGLWHVRAPKIRREHDALSHR